MQNSSDRIKTECKDYNTRVNEFILIEIPRVLKLADRDKIRE
jgi:hypothetical protein